MNSATSGASATFSVRFTLDATAAEQVADALSEADDPLALAVGRFAAGAGIEEITAYYGVPPAEPAVAALVADALPAGAAVPRLHVTSIPARDWVARAQQRLHPIRAGSFIVHGSHDRSRFARLAGAIEIDAGQAFGTGHHGTTEGCLAALSDLLKGRAPGRVLDLGTGSGVLAIAVAKRGARGVVASDEDPVAVGIAVMNARLNRVAGRVSVLEAAGLEHPRLRPPAAFDLVLANILARPLSELAPGIAKAVAAGGHLILSGLTAEQADPVAARYRAHGFALVRRRTIDGWATVVLSRRRRRRLRRPDGARAGRQDPGEEFRHAAGRSR